MNAKKEMGRYSEPWAAGPLTRTGSVTPSWAWLVELDPEQRFHCIEVRVLGVDTELPPEGERGHQEVVPRDSDSGISESPALARGFPPIYLLNGVVRDDRKIAFESGAFSSPCAAKNLQSNGA